MENEKPKRRPIEASLAQALAWGAPLWILDDDGPPPRDRKDDKTAEVDVTRPDIEVLRSAKRAKRSGRFRA